MGADGRYEKILKDVLEDRTLTDAECRLVMYLAAKPAGWTVYPELVSKDLKRSLRHWVSPTLRLLLARGLVTKRGGRIPGQPNSVVTYRLVRELVVKTADLGSAGSDTTPDLGSAGSDTTVDQPKLSDLGSAGSVVTEPAELKERTGLKRELKDQNPLDQLPLIDPPEGSEPAPEPAAGNGFKEFWEIYPRKVGKRGAESVYAKVAKKTDARVIIAGALRYRNDPNRVDEFTKHPSTWLNQGCWDDEPLPERRSGGGKTRRNLTAREQYVASLGDTETERTAIES